VLNEGGRLLLGITGVMVTEASCTSYNYIAFTSASTSKHFVKPLIGATLMQLFIDFLTIHDTRFRKNPLGSC
jgi:hypothetical protein